MEDLNAYPKVQSEIIKGDSHVIMIDCGDKFEDNYFIDLVDSETKESLLKEFELQ